MGLSVILIPKVAFTFYHKEISATFQTESKHKWEFGLKNTGELTKVQYLELVVHLNKRTETRTYVEATIFPSMYLPMWNYLHPA